MKIEVFQQQPKTPGQKGLKWFWRFKAKGHTTADGAQFDSPSQAKSRAKAVVRATVKPFQKKIGYSGVTFKESTVNGIITITWS